MNHTLNDILKPLLFYNFIIGYLPFKLKFTKTKTIMEFNSKILLINVVIYFLLNIDFNVVAATTYTPNEFNSKLQSVVHRLYIASSLFLTWILFWVNLADIKLFYQSVNSFYELTEEFDSLNIRVNYSKLKGKVQFAMLTEICITFVFSIAFIAVRLYYVDTSLWKKIMFVIENHYIHLQIFAVSYNFIFGMFTLTELFKSINRSVENFVNSSKKQTKMFLMNISRLHEETCKVTRVYNCFMSTKLFLHLPMYFIIFTSNLYYVARALLQGEITGYVAVFSMWIVFCCLKMSFLVNSASTCMEEVI